MRWKKLFNKKTQNEIPDITTDNGDLHKLQREDIQDKTKRNYLAWGVVALVLFILFTFCRAWMAESNDNAMLNPMIDSIFTTFMEISIAFMGSLFVLVFIENNKGKSEDKARKKELGDIFKNTFVDYLIKKNTLVSKLNEDSVDSFMQDCISYYCDKLSAHYKNYIKNSINVFRQDLDYTVIVDKEESTINQIIRYERFFKNNTKRTTFQLKCLFLFSTNDLDEEMHNDSYFFREELTNKDVIKNINEILYPKSSTDNDITNDINETIDPDSTKKLIKELNFKITLVDTENNIPSMVFDEKCNSEQIIYKVVKNKENKDCGILFYIDIPEQYILTQNSYVHYKAAVSCLYKTDINNIFYCLFSNPTTGKTKFEIRFLNFTNKTNRFNINKDVKLMTILSLKKGDYTINNYGADSLTFETSKTIFPRSGIVIHWDTDTDTKTDTDTE